MATGASIGFMKLGVQSFSGSPVTYNNIEEVRSVTGIGHTGTQVDVTNYDSLQGSKEFIAGLKEGDEVTVTCNWLFTSNTQQLALIAAADAGQNRNFQLTYTNSSPNKKVKFTAAVLGYTYGPDATAPNTLTFKLKISGALT